LRAGTSPISCSRAGAARAREIALRTALGAGRGRIVRQLLTESIVLALVATGAGLLLANWFIAAVIAWSPGGVPRLDQAHLNPVGARLLPPRPRSSASVLSGLAPSLRLARTDVRVGLRGRRPRNPTGGGFRDRLRAGLIVAEVALSLLLLFGAGLLIRSGIALQRVNPGFDPAGVLTARFSLPETVYGDIGREKEALRRINDAAAQPASRLCGKRSRRSRRWAPAAARTGSSASKQARSTRDDSSSARCASPHRDSSPRCERRYIEGRAFTDDDRAGGQKVMVISEALAARAFPGADPNRQAYRLLRGRSRRHGTGRSSSASPATFTREAWPPPPGPSSTFRWRRRPNDAWHWFRAFYVVIRTDGNPAAAAEPLRRALKEIDPELPLFDRADDERASLGHARDQRASTRCCCPCSASSACCSPRAAIYGVIAYFVAQRTQEIGVRIALGASRSSVVRLIPRPGPCGPYAIGAVVGVGAALAAGRVLASQLFSVSPTDPLNDRRRRRHALRRGADGERRAGAPAPHRWIPTRALMAE